MRGIMSLLHVTIVIEPRLAPFGAFAVGTPIQLHLQQAQFQPQLDLIATVISRDDPHLHVAGLEIPSSQDFGDIPGHRVSPPTQPLDNGSFIAVADQRLHRFCIAFDRQHDRSLLEAVTTASYRRNHLTAIGHAESNGKGAVVAKLDRLALQGHMRAGSVTP